MGGKKKRMKQKTSSTHLVRKSVPVPQEYLKSLDGCEQLLAQSESQSLDTDSLATAVVADSTPAAVEQMVKFSKYISMQDQLNKIIQHREQALKVTAATYADAKMKLIEERKKHDAILYEYKSDLVDSTEQYRVLLNDKTMQDKLIKQVILERDTLKEAQGKFLNFKSKHDVKLRLLENENKETKTTLKITELEINDATNRIKYLERANATLQGDKEAELNSLRMKIQIQIDVTEKEKQQNLKVAIDEFQKEIETLKNQNVVNLKIMEDKMQTRIVIVEEQKKQDLKVAKEEFEKDIKEQTNKIRLKDLCIQEQANQICANELCIQEQTNKTQEKDLCIQEQANHISANDLCIQEQANKIQEKDLCIQEQANKICANDLCFQEQIEDIYAKDIIIEEKMKESCAKDRLIESILVEEVCEIHDKTLEIKLKNNELELKDGKITEMVKMIQMRDFEIMTLKYNQDSFNNEILTLKANLKSVKKKQIENAIYQQSKLLISNVIGNAVEQLQLENMDEKIKQLKGDRNKMKTQMQEFMSTVNNELERAKAIFTNKYKTEITQLKSQLDLANEKVLKYMELYKNATNIGKRLLHQIQDMERMNIKTLMKRCPFTRHINGNKLQDFIIELKLDILKLFQDNCEVIKNVISKGGQKTSDHMIACTNNSNLDCGTCKINEYDLTEAMFTCKTKLQLDCKLNNIDKTRTSLDGEIDLQLDCKTNIDKTVTSLDGETDLELGCKTNIDKTRTSLDGETDVQLDCRTCSIDNNNTLIKLDKPSCKITEENEIQKANKIARKRNSNSKHNCNRNFFQFTYY